MYIHHSINTGCIFGIYWIVRLDTSMTLVLYLIIRKNSFNDYKYYPCMYMIGILQCIVLSEIASAGICIVILIKHSPCYWPACVDRLINELMGQINRVTQ